MRLVILPGMDGTGDFTKTLSPFFDAPYSCEIVRYPAEMDRYLDITDWLRPLLGDSDFVLVAESFSGPIALSLAAEKPKGLRAVILVASFAQSPRRLPPGLPKLLYLFPFRNRIAVKLGQGFLIGAQSAPAFASSFLLALSGITTKTLEGRLKSILTADRSSEVAAISAPGLFIAASDDWLVTKTSTEVFREAGWTLAQISGPHFLLLTRAKEVSKIIKSFLASLG
jgi:pimeloyl-[acyl-carrier protein] methyl ester esterase